MVAQRHIHMLPEDAARLGVHDGQNVSLEVDGIRGGCLKKYHCARNQPVRTGMPR